MKYYLGIDVGLQGAINVLDENKQLISNIKIPIIKNSKSKNEYDLKKLYDILFDFSKIENINITLELQRAMPGQGTVSMFTTGMGFGIFKGILYSIYKNFNIVDPKKWQNYLINIYFNSNDIIAFNKTIESKYILSNIDDSEFREWYSKMIKKKSTSISKAKTAYLYYLICKKENLDTKQIKYSDNNIVDSYLISFYASMQNEI